MVTIRDVASRAGVSRSTVSLVLNKSVLVKEETRQHVLAVIRDMGYVPNNNARGLSGKTTNSLGVVIMADKPMNPKECTYGFDQSTGISAFSITNGIMAGLLETDYGVVTERFCASQMSLDLPRIVKASRVDGVFLVGSPIQMQLIENMKKSGVPFVVAGVDQSAQDVDCVFADPGIGTVMEAEYLYQAGYQNICFVNGPKSFHSSYTRLTALSAYIEREQRPFNYEWVLYSKQNHGQAGYQVFKEFWEQGNRPDAILTANGYMALGIMRYLYEKGVHVPEDIGIIAYDDSALCGYAAPGLTSINIRKEMIGERAAQCLTARIKNPGKPIEEISIEPYLVERGSVRHQG